LSQIEVEKLILLSIYEVAGREIKKIKQKTSSQKLAEIINKKNPQKAFYIPDLKKTKEYLVKNFDGDIIIVMGAGNVYELEKLLST